MTMINKTNIAQWIGSVSGVSGSILISLNIGATWVLLGFSLFLVSNFTLAFWGYKVKAYGVLWMNVAYIFIDSLGVYRWF